MTPFHVSFFHPRVRQRKLQNPLNPCSNKGRPDSADLESAAAFGNQIREKLQQAKSENEFNSLSIPGNRPYKTPENLYMIKKVRETIAFTPETETESCTQCGVCVEVCPEAAIDSCDVANIDRWRCILCFACIK